MSNMIVSVGREDGLIASVEHVSEDRFKFVSEASDGCYSREELVHLAIGIIEALANENERDMVCDTLGC